MLSRNVNSTLIIFMQPHSRDSWASQAPNSIQRGQYPGIYVFCMCWHMHKCRCTCYGGVCILYLCTLSTYVFICLNSPLQKNPVPPPLHLTSQVSPLHQLYPGRHLSSPDTKEESCPGILEAGVSEGAEEARRTRGQNTSLASQTMLIK